MGDDDNISSDTTVTATPEQPNRKNTIMIVFEDNISPSHPQRGSETFTEARTNTPKRVENADEDGIDDEPEPTPSPKKINRKSFWKKELSFGDGYDSDGFAGPFVPNEELEIDEMLLPESGGCSLSAPPFVDSVEDASIVDPNLIRDQDKEEGSSDQVSNNLEGEKEGGGKENQMDTSIVRDAAAAVETEEQLMKLTVDQLKDKLREAQLKTSGKKAELVARLLKPSENDKVGKSSKSKESASARDEMKCFPPTAYWESLKPDAEPVEEPVNAGFSSARAPTIAEAEAEFVPVKYNFSHTFDRPVFAGTMKRAVVDRRGKQKKVGGKDQFEVVRREKGTVKLSFIEQYMLDENTTPAQYAEIFFPLKRNLHSPQVGGGLKKKRKSSFPLSKCECGQTQKQCKRARERKEQSIRRSRSSHLPSCGNTLGCTFFMAWPRHQR